MDLGRVLIRSKDINQLSVDEVRQEMGFLKEELEHHNDLYYNKSAPVLSDSQYDQLFLRLTKLENIFPQFAFRDSPTQKAGAPVERGFAKIKHTLPMLSLANAFDQVDIIDFLKRINRFLGRGLNEALDIVAELKIDGLSFSARYERGNLVNCATRGDGEEGEDITENIKSNMEG